MDTKSLRVEIKDESKGLVRAIFSTFNVVDSDGDVTVPGAFTDGAAVRISAYGHASWSGTLPVGKGVIRQTATAAILEGEFFLDTTHGADTFRTVQRMGELQEWSYGYDPVKYSFGEFDGRRVRFLEQQQVHEVSPVLLGAGIGTRTLSAKSGQPAVGLRAARPIAPHECEVTSRSWDGAKTLAGLPPDARPSELRTVFAWVDADGDPELTASYKFGHHHGIGGPANVRACLAGIAALNGAKSGLPDIDRQAVYEHLAGHLRDTDRDVPELRAQPGTLKFHEELVEGMGMLSTLLDSASRVVALRAEKGKPLSRVNAEILGWIDDDLRRLKALLSVPAGDEPDVDDEVLASIVVASIARLQGL